jgi:hypothetical protein
MKKKFGTFFGLSRWGVGAALLALCAFAPVSSRAGLYLLSFTDTSGHNSSGSGTIDVTGTTADSGSFTVTAGSMAGTYTLDATAGSDSHFSWDTTVNVGSDPFLDTSGLLFTSGADEINLYWTFADSTYGLNGYVGGVTYNGATGSATLTPVPEPITYALAAFGLIFVGGSAGRFCLGRRRSATAS